MACGFYTTFRFMCALGAWQCASSSMGMCKSPEAKSLSYCAAYQSDGVKMPIMRTGIAKPQMSDEAEHVKEILASVEAAQSPFSAWFLTAMVTLWETLGTELVIFAITVGFAACARTSKGKKTARDCDSGAFSGKSPPKSPPPRRSSPPPRGVVPFGDPGGKPMPFGRAAAARPAATIRRSQDESSKHVDKIVEPVRSELHEPQLTNQREAWKIIDEIVGGCRANSNLRSAHRAIELYLELQQLLREQGSKIGEATWYARFSASDVYSCMVQSVVRTSQCHLVEKLIEDMVLQGVPRPLPFYESTMKQLAVQKQYQVALSVYDRMSVDGVQPSLVMLSCLVSFSAEVGSYDRAIDFFKQLSAQGKPSIRAYMTLLRVHSKRQNWSASLATLREMQRQGVPLDSLALNVVLSTAIAADKVEEADQLILEGHGMSPPISDSVSYNTLIKGYLQRCDLTMATKIVDRMQEHGIKPNSITFNTMMDKAMRSFQHNQAWELYGKMHGCGLKADKLTCSILLKGLDKAALREHVASAVQLLQEAGHLCDGALFSSLSGIVLDAAAQAGDPQLLATVQELRVTVTPTAWRSY